MKKAHFPRLKYKQEGILNFIEYKHVIYKIVYIIMLLLLFIFLFLAIFPLFLLVVQSFKTPEEINASTFSFWPKEFNILKIVEVWNQSAVGINFLNSLIVTSGATLCSIVFNGLLAYSTSIIKPKGSHFVHYLIVGGYMIPTILCIVPLFSMIVKLGLMNNYLTLCLCFGANAFYYMQFKNFFDKIPNELIEAMKIDGSSDFGIFFRLIIPISKSIVGIIAIFTISASWSDFLLPNLVLTNDSMKTLMVQIYSIKSTMGTVTGYTYDKLLMLLVISIIPQIVLFLVFQKQITGGAVEGGVKG